MHSMAPLIKLIYFAITMSNLISWMVYLVFSIFLFLQSKQTYDPIWVMTHHWITTPRSSLTICFSLSDRQRVLSLLPLLQQHWQLWGMLHGCRHPLELTCPIQGWINSHDRTAHFSTPQRWCPIVHSHLFATYISLYFNYIVKVEKFSITSIGHQWIIGSEWVPSK